MTRRAIMGALPNGQMGLWISRPGIDVVHSGPQDRLFDSTAPALQILLSGRATVGGKQTVTIPFAAQVHPPFVEVHMVESERIRHNHFFRTRPPTAGIYTVNANLALVAQSTRNNLSIYNDMPAGSSMDVTYILFSLAGA